MSKVAQLLADLMAVIANHAKGLEEALGALPPTPVDEGIKVVGDEIISAVEAKEAASAPVERPAAAPAQ
jgi:hypothetical protein